VRTPESIRVSSVRCKELLRGCSSGNLAVWNRKLLPQLAHGAVFPANRPKQDDAA